MPYKQEGEGSGPSPPINCTEPVSYGRIFPLGYIFIFLMAGDRRISKRLAAESEGVRLVAGVIGTSPRSRITLVPAETVQGA